MPEDVRLRLHTDGASRGNPGHAAAGIAIYREDGSLLARGKKYLGVMTNNEAEYRALVVGLKAAVRYQPSSLTVCMDSELVVRQMIGQYRVKDATLQRLHAEAQELVLGLAEVRFQHVPRSQNAAADALANEALDEQKARKG